jgi:uncharacterized protein (UPF0332 family)
MSLESWLANHWLLKHEASNKEIDDLLEAARHDLQDARQDISPSWSLAISYNAALRVCTAALMIKGYRASRDQKHYRTIAALPLILGAQAEEIAGFLDGCRTKRHDVTYEALTSVSQSESDELITAAEELIAMFEKWRAAQQTN